VAVPFSFFESTPSNPLDDPNTDFTEAGSCSSRADLSKNRLGHSPKALTFTLDQTRLSDHGRVNRYGCRSSNRHICLASLFPPMRC
jgi:hypothetical protein